jgi:hypothetical protein
VLHTRDGWRFLESSEEGDDFTLAADTFGIRPRFIFEADDTLQASQPKDSGGQFWSCRGYRSVFKEDNNETQANWYRYFDSRKPHRGRDAFAAGWPRSGCEGQDGHGVAGVKGE